MQSVYNKDLDITAMLWLAKILDGVLQIVKLSLYNPIDL